MIATASPQHPRITAIDALRGFVMFMMIFVNYLSGAGKIVPDWMVHFNLGQAGERQRHFVGDGRAVPHDELH